MPRYVVLTESPDASPQGYDVRLGPLRFVSTADTVSETIGDGLEQVGAAVVAGGRRPRPLKLKVPVRGDHREPDQTAAGVALRRRVRALLNNARWSGSGLYWRWEPDPDLDGWLLVGGGELAETDPGISFGEFDLDLTDVFIVARPGTHRPGRRAIVADRRTGLVPRDTRRLVYSRDFAAVALPDEPLYLPGDTVDLVRSGNQPVVATTLGPLRNSRRLWRTTAAIDGETISYMPDVAVLPGRDRYLDLDDLGAVRVWDLTDAAAYVPDAGTTERDTRPDVYLGWQPVFGDLLEPERTLAIDNGICRLVWLGPGAATGGLSVEQWDESDQRYRQHGRVLHALDVREVRAVEITQERVIIEWRAAHLAMRAVLQRGWPGPRIESYNDSGATAALEYEVAGASVTTTPSPTLPSVQALASNPSGGTMWLAAGTTDTVDGVPSVIGSLTTTRRVERSRALVVQLGHAEHTTDRALGSLSLVDARPIPTLVRR